MSDLEAMLSPAAHEAIVGAVVRAAKEEVMKAVAEVEAASTPLGGALLGKARRSVAVRSMVYVDIIKCLIRLE
jgi:hypothetical protein